MKNMQQELRSEKKEKQDKLFDELVETLSTDYETKIK